MRNGIGPRIGEFGATFDARVTAREEGTPCYSGSRAPFKAVCETALQDAGAAIPFLRIMEVFRWIDTPQSPANLEEPPVLGSLKIFIHFCRNLLTDPKDVQVALHPETIKRIVALGGTVSFTCYRDGNSEHDGAANGSQPIRS